MVQTYCLLRLIGWLCVVSHRALPEEGLGVARKGGEGNWKMTGKKGMITFEELVSLRSRYLIPDFFEFLAPLEGETLRSHCKGRVCPNKWMFKAGVWIPLERYRDDQPFWASLLSRKVILGGISFIGKRTTKIVLNLPDSVSDCKLRFFYSRFRAGEEQVRYVGLEELKSGLKWHSTRGAFLRWCEGLSFYGGLEALLRSEPMGPSGPSSGTRSSSRGSRASVSRHVSDRVWPVARPKKRKRLIDVAASEGVGEEVERLNAENLRLGLALSREEAPCSGLVVASPEGRDDTPGLVSSPILVAALLEVSLGPIPGGSSPRGLVPPFGLGDAAGTSLSLNPAFDLRADTFIPRCEGSSGERGSPIRCGILASIFGDASSCSSNEEIFPWPFNMEARVMKILGDLLAIESRGIWENHALGLLSSLDEERRGLSEQMLKKFLPDVWRELSELEERIRLIDGCASGEEYRYHILRQDVRFPVDRPRTQDQFGTSSLMEEDGRKVIAAGKHPKEVVVRQVPLIKETSAKARSIARRWMEAEREKCHFEERADLEAARDNVEGILLSKRDLDKALASAEEEAGDLRSLNRDLEASVQHLRDQAEQDREGISGLLSKLDTLRAEQDEAIRKAAGAEARALQSLAEPPTLASGARSPLTHDPSEGSSFGEKALIVWEPMTDLDQEGL
ncbi:hypothetical protein ACLOJK_022797 [Asimina triloba]